MRLWSLALVGSLVLPAGVARADARSDTLIRQAAALYQAGDYEGAAATLLVACDPHVEPRCLFNIARAYDKAGNTAEATRYYRRYLDAKDTEPPLVQKAHDALDRLEPKPAPPPEPPPVVVLPPPTILPPPPPIETKSLPATLPKESAPVAVHPSHAGAYVLVGVGIAGLAAGLGVAIWADVTANQLHDSLDPTTKPGLRDAAYTRGTAADITMGVGAALAATGIVLRLTSSGSVPVVRAGLGGVTVAWKLPGS